MIAYSTTRTTLFFATLCMLVSPAAGCGGNVVIDHGEGASGPSGAGAGGGISSSTEGAGAGESTGTSTEPPSQYGTPTVACTEKTGQFVVCAQGFGDDPAGTLKAECLKSHGQITDHCPAAGTIGCCALQEPKIGFIEECIYGDLTSSKQFEKVCTQQQGKFTSSP